MGLGQGHRWGPGVSTLSIPHPALSCPARGLMHVCGLQPAHPLHSHPSLTHHPSLGRAGGGGSPGCGRERGSPHPWDLHASAAGYLSSRGTLVLWEGVVPTRLRAGCSEMKGAWLPGLEGGLEGAQSTEVRGQEQVADREVAEFGLDMLTRGHVSNQPAEFGGLCPHHEGCVRENAGRQHQPGWNLPIWSFVHKGGVRGQRGQ